MPHRIIMRAMRWAGLAVVALTLCVSCQGSTAKKRGNVVLIIIDTLRPDHLGCYGYEQATSPRIDTFASEGTLFEHAVTCVPLTLPAVSSMLTSTYPVFNNVRYNGKFYLSDASVSLAEILKDEGYCTAAFVGGFPLDARFKTNQGFDVYDDEFSNSAEKREYGWIGYRVADFERTAAEVNERVFQWLETSRDRPFFLMVHYFDPHLPYTPASPYADRFELPYDGEVAYTDEQVGRLLDRLDQMGLKDSTLIILTADHGESLGAHNEATHGEFVYDTTMRIPLVAYHHDRIPKGLRVDTMVRIIDIVPTILDFLGIPEGPQMQGASLLPALNGNLKETPILLETMFNYYEAANLGIPPISIMGLRTSEWKLMSVTVEEEGGTRHIDELYDLRNDPLEVSDVGKDHKEMLERLASEMQTMIRKHSAGGLPKDNMLEMDRETREKLKALGYLK